MIAHFLLHALYGQRRAKQRHANILALTASIQPHYIDTCAYGAIAPRWPYTRLPRNRTKTQEYT